MIIANNLHALKNIRHVFLGRAEGIPKRGLNDTPLFLAKQVHGDVLLRVDAKSKVEDITAIEADALWTTERNLTVAVKTGDCVPLLVSDKAETVVMAVHLGWKGAANGLGPKAIKAVCATLSIAPHDLVAAIGPCISFDKFEVRSDVVEALKKSVSPEGLLEPINETQWKVDLQGWVERQLQNVGIVDIEKIPRCTFSEPDVFHSARRDAGSAGRQVSCIMIA